MNLASATTSPFVTHRTRPLWIMVIVSIPSSKLRNEIGPRRRRFLRVARSGGAE
ncbi:MAG TPA: hypothetical protein VGM27_12455 [Acidobacteriaceae bacterium]